MSLVVVTGGARSGKSSVAGRLAVARGGPVVVAVAGMAADEEMLRRIEAHRSGRSDAWSTLELGADFGEMLRGVPEDKCLLLECLGSLVGRVVSEECMADAVVVTRDVESRVESRVAGIVELLLKRHGDTIVVTNEVGDGVVPAFADGRLFRDVLGRANSSLVEAADKAWLVIAGRCVELTGLPSDPEWPEG